MSDQIDHYSTLGVDPTASKETIRKAYRRKAKSTHPDAGGSAEAFQALELAHRILSDDEARAHYDATGESAPPDIDGIANSIIREIVLKVIAKAEEKTIYLDINLILETNIREGITKAEAELAAVHKKIARLEKLAARVKAKTRNIDVLTAIFNEQIMAAKGELSPRGTHIEALKRAQELCTTFTFEPEKQDEPEPTQVWRTATNSDRGWFFR